MKTKKLLQFRQLNVHRTHHAKKNSNMELILAVILQPM